MVKRMITPRDARLTATKVKNALKAKAGSALVPGAKADSAAGAGAGAGAPVRTVAAVPSSMFFKYNTALGPPYRLLLDTNFINFAVKNKLEIIRASMDCLLAKCIPCITDCVMAELEKLGPKYKVALRIAKDARFERITCGHKGTYADDCLVHRVTEHRCYIVATCDKDLKRRLRKIPGVPIMFIAEHKFAIERLPDAPK
jgi:U3 small nucleolar RNA-associated protein 24